MFKFTIISFHYSALDRQISEAVRISRTGGERILNSKGEFNRCEIPRIIAVDTREEPNLGDLVTTGDEGSEEHEPVAGETQEPDEVPRQMSKKEECFEVVDKVIEALDQKMVPYSDLVAIACRGKTKQRCSQCLKDIIVWGIVLADIGSCL